MKYEAEDYQSDLKALMNTDAGRRVIWELLSRCGLYSVSTAPSEYERGMHEGMRALGVRLYTELHQCAFEELVAYERAIKYHGRKVRGEGNE